jgi:integrase
MSGLRKAELENLEWSDIDFKAGTVTARSPLAGR